jgi:hypothetical protein
MFSDIYTNFKKRSESHCLHQNKTAVPHFPDDEIVYEASLNAGTKEKYPGHKA